MTLTTRKPTGKPPWPLGVIAGTGKAGKSYACAAASACQQIDRTLWFGCGEDDPDEYGAIPGARFEIVQHDGTYRGLLNALTEAGKEQSGKPELWVLDSGTRAWGVLKDMATDALIDRLRRRAARSNRPFEIPDDVKVTPDLWNLAGSRWEHVLNALRAHTGPSLITARLDVVSVFENGEPTKEKRWRVEGQKDLVYDVDFVVQIRGRGNAFLTAVRSLKWDKGEHDEVPLDKFNVVDLWASLGVLEKDAIGPRAHTDALPVSDEEQRGGLLTAIAALADAVGAPRQQIADDWATTHDGEAIAETTDIGGLEVLRSDLQAQADQKKKD